MSEYQSYACQTLDRPLTVAERTAVAKLSSHIEVSATHASVEYQWGDFKHDPIQVLARYFDAFQYYANWGNERLAFRFPKHLLDADRLEPYLWADCAELQTVGDYYILSFASPEEEPPEWDEQGDGLADLAALRADIVLGDLRSLYLASLLGIVANLYLDNDEGEAEAELEPSVPPGLGQLTPALEAFIRFMRIDPFLVAAAAEASAPLAAASSASLATTIAQLPRTECDAFLQRLLQGEANLQVVLQRRLQELAGASTPAAPDAAPRRTIGALLARADELQRTAVARAKAAAEAKRIQELQAFAPQAARAWQTVEDEIGRKNASGYDNAVQLLVKLRALAAYQGELPLFKARIATLVDRYKSQRSFVERVGKAKL